jgi:hypothetical protein
MGFSIDPPTEEMIISGSAALGISKSEYVRLCIAKAQTGEALEKALAVENPSPDTPLSAFEDDGDRHSIAA